MHDVSFFCDIITRMSSKRKSRQLREIEAAFVNPFLSSVHSVLDKMGNINSHRQDVRLEEISSFSGDVLVIMKVDGTITGLVIIKLSEETMKKLVSRFLFGVPIVEIDEMVTNSLKEFILRIAEKARKKLIEGEYHSNVTHGITLGKPLNFANKLEFIAVTYETDCGTLKVYFNIMKTTLIPQDEQT